MIVIPAVDVRGGRVVRLRRGRPEAERAYGSDPLEAASRFVEEGAMMLHVVDLDRALGTGDNREALRAVVRGVPVPVQVGGGLRSHEALEEVLGWGAARAVLGTGAVRDPRFLARAVAAFGDRVASAVDTDGRAVRVGGWAEEAGPLGEVLAELERAGAPRFVVTAVARDGTLEGPDLALYRRVLRMTSRPVVASGGVRGAGDLRRLRDLGLEAVIVGTALYEGGLTVSEALEVAG